MDLNKEALEGGPRLAWVRKTKKYLMITQIIIVCAMVILLTLVDGQVQLKPFYYNIGSFIYFVILMTLVIGVEDMIFRILELRYGKSDSSKYYMLKSSMRRSVFIIAIAAVVMVVVLTPVMTTLINLTSEEGSTTTVAPFNNRDPLGLTTVDTVHVKTSAPAEVVIVSEENYLLYAGDFNALRQHAVVMAEEAGFGVDLAFPHTSFGLYYIVVQDDRNAVLTYDVHKALAPSFVGLITTFCLAFIIAYAAWIVYCYPVRNKYAKGAIYR
jgi:hypothetical protein